MGVRKPRVQCRIAASARTFSDSSYRGSTCALAVSRRATASRCRPLSPAVDRTQPWIAQPKSALKPPLIAVRKFLRHQRARVSNKSVRAFDRSEPRDL